jgi:hypothetical protein
MRSKALAIIAGAAIGVLLLMPDPASAARVGDAVGWLGAALGWRPGWGWRAGWGWGAAAVGLAASSYYPYGYYPYNYGYGYGRMSCSLAWS